MTEPGIDWPPPLTNHSLGETEIEVWAADLRISEERLRSLGATLSADERARTERFHFESHRNRFIAGRGLLRTILGRHLNQDPGEIQFVYTWRGKPALAKHDPSGPLQFNLAHSGNLVLIALARAADVGVDIERIRRLSEAGNIVARFFSPREREAFESLSELQKPRAFFNLWTRKEAWLKATAEGIGQSLSQVEVSFRPEEPAQLVRLFGRSEPAQAWRLWELAPASGYVGALAAPSRMIKLHCWRWTE